MAAWNEPETLAQWIAVALLFFLVLGAVLVWLVRKHLLRMQAAQQLLMQVKLEHQQQLLHDSVRIQERERNRIAQELHDNLINKLHLLTVLQAQPSPKANPAEVLRESIGIARNISHQLCPPFVESSTLKELIAQYTTDLEQQHVVHSNISTRATVPLTSETKLHVLRILQELHSNLIKYAKAKEVVLQMRHTNNSLAVLFRDNGIGFNSDVLTKGLGMRNIELRTQLLGGTSVFKSRSEKGTTFILHVQLQHP